MSIRLDMLRAAWPMLLRALRSGQIVRPQCRLVDPDPDIRSDVDVEIPMSGGYVLTCTIFRSKKRLAAGERTPVIMCAHPYDNHLTPALKKTPLNGPPQQYRLIPQSGGIPSFSTLTSWEAPDPDFWVPAGYTLVNVNLPGYANSGGPATVMSDHQGRAYYEAIRWAGAQPWCDGGVGLSGVSYLAISQYHAAAHAAEDDPQSALKCICPWEGVSDMYRDIIAPGGVRETGFLDFWWQTEVLPALNTTVDDFLEHEGAVPAKLLDAHPFFDAYWQEKAVAFDKVRTPMLVCASFSDHELHTMGSFRAFEKAVSNHKWVYTHRGGKWSSFYSREVKALMRDFMDHFLKGIDNRFATLKPVRLEVRASRDEIHDVRWEEAWPLPSTDFMPLYLDRGVLNDGATERATEIAYEGRTGSAVFDHVFETDTELSGYMRLKLWVEARPDPGGVDTPEDMILCVFVDKIDTEGEPVRFYGSVGVSEDVVTRGYLRVSRREIDEVASEPWLPVPTGTSEQKLSPGDIVSVEIALRPSSTFFAAGEGLRLTVAGHEIQRAPIFRKDVSLNEGHHILHIGGERDSHLLIPRIAI